MNSPSFFVAIFHSVLADLQSASSYYKDLQSDYCSLFVDGKA